MSITLGSLFDGIGGFPLAAQRVGITPVWASEIEPFPLRVSALRFPNMAQLGDINQLKGTDVPPVDIVTGGSPCQDLSIAGARAGLAGERSGLFLEQIRLIREMREVDQHRERPTEFVRPRFMVWENVPGAFSSAGGRGLPDRPGGNAADRRAGLYSASTSGRDMAPCWGRCGRRILPGLAHLGRAILRCPPAQGAHLPCGRFWRHIRPPNTI